MCAPKMSPKHKPWLPLAYVISRYNLLSTFPALRLIGGSIHLLSQQPRWGTEEVCAGGSAAEPGGAFLLALHLLHRCLLAYMSCHMFPAWPLPEGAELVRTPNLPNLTRASLTLTGTHGIMLIKHSRRTSFAVLLSSPSLNCWMNFLPLCLVFYMF